jgi:putative membrane protein
LKPHPNVLLAAIIAVVTAWSAWQPYDRLTWWLESLPVFLAFAAIFLAQAALSWRFSTVALIAIGIHMVILLVGGHHTYARVPAGQWVTDWLDWERNHYDRLGHLAQGFVPAIVCREVLLRNHVVARGPWLAFCVISFCLAFSALYELIEWAAALLSAEAAESFLGTQGDPWDTQWDMFLAGIGASTALALTSRIHDRSIARLRPFG